MEEQRGRGEQHTLALFVHKGEITVCIWVCVLREIVTAG